MKNKEQLSTILLRKYQSIGVNNLLLMVVNVILLILINTFQLNIIILLMTFVFVYSLFLFTSYKSLKSLRNLILSAEVIFVSIFFI